MKYPESTQRSAEYLRMALSLMSKHAAALHPITYAVWYEYAAGNNPGLKQELDNHLTANSKLDEDLTRKLYASYVAELDPQTLERFNEEFRHLLQQVGQAAARTGQDTSKFGLELEQFGQDLGPSLPPDELNRRVERMLREIQSVHASIRGLNERLDESRNEVERLKGELIRAREEAVIDGLSGLLNRKAFDERVEALLVTVNGSGVTGPTVIMIDIDNFKQVNDKYGHLFGDAVIRTIGHLIKSSVKGQDIAARYGGEEFALVLPETPLAGAKVVADRLRFAVSQARIRRLNSEDPVGNISISAGVAAHRAGDDMLAMFSRADEALYQSKSGGRNRITVAE